MLCSFLKFYELFALKKSQWISILTF